MLGITKAGEVFKAGPVGSLAVTEGGAGAAGAGVGTGAGFVGVLFGTSADFFRKRSSSFFING
jgi:hypothetical protein